MGEEEGKEGTAGQGRGGEGEGEGKPVEMKEDIRKESKSQKRTPFGHHWAIKSISSGTRSYLGQQKQSPAGVSIGVLLP